MKLARFIAATKPIEFFSPLFQCEVITKNSVIVDMALVGGHQLADEIDCCLVAATDTREVWFVPAQWKTKGNKAQVTIDLLLNEDAAYMISVPIFYAARTTDQLSAADLRSIASFSKSIMQLVASKAGSIFDGLEGNVNDDAVRDRINRDVMIKYPELVSQIEELQIKQRQTTLALCLGCDVAVLHLLDRVPNSGQIMQALEAELGIVIDEEGEVQTPAIEAAPSESPQIVETEVAEIHEEIEVEAAEDDSAISQEDSDEEEEEIAVKPKTRTKKSSARGREEDVVEEPLTEALPF